VELFPYVGGIGVSPRHMHWMQLDLGFCIFLNATFQFAGLECQSFCAP